MSDKRIYNNSPANIEKTLDGLRCCGEVAYLYYDDCAKELHCYIGGIRNKMEYKEIAWRSRSGEYNVTTLEDFVQGISWLEKEYEHREKYGSLDAFYAFEMLEYKNKVSQEEA